MSHHTVELDESFVDYFADLDSLIQDQITVIWKELEADPFYRPLDDMYVTDLRIKESDEFDYMVCQHINGWVGWTFLWFWEYFDAAREMPKHVVLMLEHQSPPYRIEPRLPN